MGRLRRLGGDTLVRNALALIMTTGVTSVFGFLFWAVAARRFDTTVVGRTTALIAAAGVIGVVAQLNLASVLGRFLPTAAEKSRRLVKICYVTSIGLAVVLAGGFVAANIGHTYLRGQASFELLFVLAAALLLLGSLQDAVLISLRKSPVVLAENLTLAVARLLLLLALAHAVPTVGIVLAYVLPAVVSAPVVGYYIFTRLIPRHEQASALPSTLPTPRRLLYFIGAAASRSIVATGTTLCLPLVVAATLGLRATAYFNLPWLINTSFGLFLGNVSMSYVVQARFDRAASQDTLRRAMLIGLWVIVAGTVLETLIAPLLLPFLGAQFASQGTTLMRLLGIATPFSAPVIIYTTFNSLDQRVWRLVALEVVYSVILISISPTMLRHYGVAGEGWSYLIAEAVFGIGSIPPAMRYLRNHQRLVAEEATIDMDGLLTG